MATDYSSTLQSFIRESTQAQAKLLRGTRVGNRPFKSAQPYQYDLESAGLMLLCDYEYDYDDGRADATITTVRLMGYDGSEYPLKPAAIRSTTWNEICELIADEIDDSNDCAAQALADPVCPDCHGKGAVTDTGVHYCNCEEQP